jgi:hypothetical protein
VGFKEKQKIVMESYPLTLSFVGERVPEDVYLLVAQRHMQTHPPTHQLLRLFYFVILFCFILFYFYFIYLLFKQKVAVS